MKTIFIETNTLKGLMKAERYLARGWKIHRTGLNIVWMIK